MSAMDELRARHAEYMELFNEAAADAGGVEHWKKTHRTEWLQGNLTTGKTQRLQQLAAEIARLREQVEAEESANVVPPTLETIGQQAARIKTLEGWVGEELANAGRNLGEAIYAKGFIDALLFIASLI